LPALANGAGGRSRCRRPIISASLGNNGQPSADYSPRRPNTCGAVRSSALMSPHRLQFAM
jgi:hypothetical protein